MNPNMTDVAVRRRRNRVARPAVTGVIGNVRVLEVAVDVELGHAARRPVRHAREGRDRRVGRYCLRVRLSGAAALALHLGQRRRGALLVLVELGVRELGRA